MHAGQKRFLEERFGARSWYGRSKHGRRVIRDFDFEGREIRGWTLQHAKRRADPPGVRSLWRHDDSLDELLGIDVVECGSVKAAHDQLLEALGNIESGAIERRADKNAPGDVAFGLANTMLLFALANLVVWIRNAGRKLTPVGTIARDLDALLVRKLGPVRRRPD
ncbi:MAG TPA: hypothetical protein VKB68_17695 [Stellaceae bacterium]|nr:hypothetical protein [Stellaceae bacterium]